jgi:hypothetical protein
MHTPKRPSTMLGAIGLVQLAKFAEQYEWIFLHEYVTSKKREKQCAPSAVPDGRQTAVEML